MTEIVENTIQLVMTGACSGIAVYRAVRDNERAWALFALFSGIYCLGDFYWLLYLLFFGNTPQHYSVADMSWNASYLFLLLLIIYVRVDICGHRMPNPDEEAQKAAEPNAKKMKMDESRMADRLTRLDRVRPVVWLVPLFTVGMCVFFMQWGDYISNIITAVIMTGIIWHGFSGFIYRYKDPAEKSAARPGSRPKMLFMCTLLFCFSEYAMWVSSCFWDGDSITNPYYWFDILLSVSVVLFVPALEKALADAPGKIPGKSYGESFGKAVRR